MAPHPGVVSSHTRRGAVSLSLEFLEPSPGGSSVPTPGRCLPAFFRPAGSSRAVDQRAGGRSADPKDDVFWDDLREAGFEPDETEPMVAPVEPEGPAAEAGSGGAAIPDPGQSALVWGPADAGGPAAATTPPFYRRFIVPAAWTLGSLTAVGFMAGMLFAFMVPAVVLEPGYNIAPNRALAFTIHVTSNATQVFDLRATGEAQGCLMRGPGRAAIAAFQASGPSACIPGSLGGNATHVHAGDYSITVWCQDVAPCTIHPQWWTLQEFRP